MKPHEHATVGKDQEPVLLKRMFWLNIDTWVRKNMDKKFPKNHMEVTLECIIDTISWLL